MYPGIVGQVFNKIIWARDRTGLVPNNSRTYFGHIREAPAQMFLHVLQGRPGIHQIINEQNTPGERTRSGGDAMGDIQLTALCAGSLTVRARGENGQRYLEEAREYIARTQPASGKTQGLIELPS